ncbi:hypothetical protein [Lusitaniella coriacea]
MGRAIATHPDPFVQHLITYLQAYRSITAQEQKERLVRLMTVAIRNP